MKALERIDKGNAYSNLLLNDIIKTSELADNDRRLFTELVYGTTARKLTLAYFLSPYIANAKKIDDWVRQLLYLSVYQMTFLDKIPDHAILNDAVEIAKNYGNIGIGKFVNGVLRNVQRNGVAKLEEVQDEHERLSIEASIPKWLIEKFIQQFGMEETKKLVLSLLEPSKLSARVDVSQISREEALEVLEKEGIQAQESIVSPFGIIAQKAVLAKSSLFQSGKLTIQDETSMLVAPTLCLIGDEQVLDTCAAPGGKTTHIAQFLKNGKVTALDIHANKIKLIEENAKRLHVVDRVEVKKMDARDVGKNFEEEHFDTILIDAPCSGIGLIRRKPDVKYNKKATDFKDLPKIQLEILESAAHVLKKSGIMTYSTCTIIEEENQGVVKTFLARHPEFELIEPRVPVSVQSLIKEKMLQILPHQRMTDGFFISCFRKRN